MAKNSSFHMGDEFNGSGKTTYIRATQHNKYKPLSQENVRLTPLQINLYSAAGGSKGRNIHPRLTERLDGKGG